MTHVPRPGNPPPAPPRPPDGPREGAFALPSRLLCAALFVACGPAGLAPPPAPRASLAGYQIGADAAPPPRPPADEYADLFAFREGRAARPAAEPWPPGASLRGGDFNAHRRLERAPPGPAPAPP